MKENKLITYKSDETNIDLIFDEDTQQVWATAQNIADIFDISSRTVREHIQNIYLELELDENQTRRDFRRVQSEGNKQVERNISHYSIDMVLSVGYRTNSKKATLFRQWATQIFKQYLEQGYVINKQRAEQDPEMLKKLAAEVRELRSSEKGTYAILRDCFKICASDYNDDPKATNAFFTLLQDKFYHAITKMTAAAIVLDRADAGEINMGLTSFKGEIPTKEEVIITKNYCGSKELFELNLLSESFLVLAESLIARGVRMTMSELHNKIDDVLRLHEYDVFGGYENYLRDEANHKARSERDKYIDILKLQMLDLDNPFNLDDFYNGEYEYLREEINQITLPQVKKMLPEIQKKLLLLK